MAKLPVEITTEVSGSADVEKLADGLDRVGDSATKTGSIATGVFQGIGQKVAEVGIGLAKAGVDLAIDAIGQSIDLASNKAEAASKNNVLFGDSYGIVEKASENAAETVGLSSGKYLEATGNLGNLITNLGFTGDEAANMSVDMLQLASDMGSFNNASTEEVTEAMGAAFRGETEPIRRFGVMLSEADVKNKAMTMGLYDGVGAIDKNAKAQATYQLILEQTTAAQGDFARTSDGYANSQKIAGAKIEEALTKVGDVILPLAATVVPMLADAVTAVVDVALGVVDVFNDILAALKPLGDALNFVSDAFDFLTGKIELTDAQLDQGHLKFIQLADTAGLSADQIETAWSEVVAGIQEGRIRSDADVQAVIDNHVRAASEAEAMQAKFTDMATQAGWTADQTSAAWAEISQAIADGRVRSDADVQLIINKHVEAAQAAQRDAEITAAMADVGADATEDAAKRTAAAQTQMATTVVEQSQKAAESIKTKMAEMVEVAKKSALAISGNIVETLRGMPDKVDTIMDDLLYAINHPLELQQNLARIESELVSDNLQKGLASKNPFIRAQAEQTQARLRELWTQLTGIAWDTAHDASGNLRDGFASNYPQITADAGKLMNKLQEIYSKQLKIPAPIVGNFKTGAAGENAGGGGRASGGPVRSGTGYVVGEAGPEWFVPGANGYIIPNHVMTRPALGAGAGVTINVTAGVGDPVEIGRVVRRALDAYQRAAGTV